MVGIKQNRSIQDEKLIEAIFTSHHFADPHSKSAAAAAAATSTGSGSAAAFSVYGATSTNLIIDARPTTNAMANVAKGAGTENMEHYKGCKKAYLGVDNIHVMRDSLSRLTEALRESEPPADFGMKVVAVTEENPEQDSVSDNSQTPDRRSPVRPLPVERPLDRHALKRSNWLKHISALLEGAMLIARNVHVNSSHVLIHCSDGWDRTAQLASLAEICLDPYYRTLEGFTVLIEKDWLSFGHRFYDRSGHLSSDKFFVTAPGHGASINNDSDDESQGGFEAQAANAFWGFTKQLTSGFPGGGNSHLKETSPVFHQFLDCVWQLHRQFPQRFEFSPALLCELHHHLYSCQFGTFLYNCERDRRKPDNGKAPVAQRTVSMWNAVLSDEVRSKWLNPQYDRGLDDPKREGSDMGVLFADPKDVQFFSQLFRRDHDEMNALVVAEAEERKRLKEADIAAAANNRGGGPNEVDGVVIGPAVEGQGEDPVLDGIASTGRHGTVDLSSLAYQPRTPRAMGDSRTMPRSAAASPAGRAIPPFGATATNGSPSADDPLSSPPGAAVPTAADAAARMKTLFLGGWARVQDAVSGGSAQSPQPSRAASPAHNHNPLGREGSHSPASRDFGGAAGNASRPSSAPRTISAGSLSNMERADRPPQRSRLDAPSGPQRSDLGFRDSSPFSDASTPSAPSASRHPDPVPSSSNPNPWAAPRSDPLAHSMVNPTELGSRSSKMSSSAQQGIDSDSTSANSLPRLSDQHPHQQQQQQQQPRMSTPDPSSTTTKKESAPGSASVSASASTAAEYDPLGVGL